MITPYYLRSQMPATLPQVLTVQHDGQTFSPVILHAGYEHFSPVAREGSDAAHAHPVYHLVLYTEGHGHFSYRGRMHPCRPGTFVVASPGEPHQFPPSRSQGAVSYLEVTFEYLCATQRVSLPFSDLLALHTGMPMPRVDFPSMVDEPLRRDVEERMRRIPDVLQGGQGIADFLASIALAELLACLALALYAVPATMGEHTPVARAQREIELRFREPLRLPALAEQSGCSIGYLCRAFKRTMGVSPIAYQQHLRINAAKNLLTTTGIPCKEVATRVGFADEYYFHRMFKRLVGVTPRTYRKRAYSDAGS